MKRIKQFIILMALVFFLISPVHGYPPNNSNNNSIAQSDLNNITESEQDVVLLQHLIELDTVQLQSQNQLFVRETLVFNNRGQKNFSGSLRTWVPDGAEGIRVGKVGMTMGGILEPLQYAQNGNIISWRDFIPRDNPLPPLYTVEYVLPAEPRGTLTKTKQYSKTLIYPTLISRQPISLVLKATITPGESITITDEKGNSISAMGNPREEDDSVLYIWEMPEFKELAIEVSEPAATPAGIAGYIILGILILLVLSYPLIRKKSEKLQEIEESIRDRLKREPEEETEEVTAEKAIGETASEVSEEQDEEEAAPEDTELLGKTKDELESERDEILSSLKELEKEYASGNLLDEEYEELRRSYQKKAERITRKVEKLG